MTTPTPSTDPLEQAFRRLRDAADADAAEARANARLIAAAPDLLAACETLLSIAGIEREAPGAVERARAAIAKAKGEKP